MATPLFWAVKGLEGGDKSHLPAYLECIKTLIQAGADKNIPNGGEKTVFDMIGPDSPGLKELLA